MSAYPETDANAEQREQALAEIEASLLQQSGIDAGDREAILRHFEAALCNPAMGTGDGRAGPSRTSWVETMELLRSHQVINAAEEEDLIRQFDHATGSLQLDAVQRAARLADRAAMGSADLAREWLDGEPGSGQAASAAPAVPPHVALSLRQRR